MTNFLIVMIAVPVFYMTVVIAFIRWYIATQTMRISPVVVWTLRIVVMTIIILIMGFVTIITFFDIAGPGLWLQVCSIPFLIFACLFYVLQSRYSRFATGKQKNAQGVNRWLSHLLAIICIGIVSLSPIAGLLVVGSVYQSLIHNRVQPLIRAVEAYHADAGEYPDSIDLLIPDYIVATPEPFINVVATVLEVEEYIGFQYRECNDEDHIIWYNPPISTLPERYHFESDSWTTFDVYDSVYQVCDFLPDS